MIRADGQVNLRKGDRFRFTQDYFLTLKADREHPLGERRLLAEAGTEGRVVWSGKSFDNQRFGVWRVGVIIPGRKKPVFVNQRYMEKIG